MVYLKPRQDLNTLAPPLSVATPLSRAALIFCQKRTHKKVTKAPDVLGGQRAAFPAYFPILSVFFRAHLPLSRLSLSFSRSHSRRRLMPPLHPETQAAVISCIISLNDPVPFDLFHHLHKTSRKPARETVGFLSLCNRTNPQRLLQKCWAQMCLHGCASLAV